ncbi:SDR family NAD(P)-dependent oxidoreductase [[Actinomadura] parvosata]|uniref:SDR family NAD(P)-dependent oxidoreductase n=1 Tax=[Actinomadura] parvosata TaxID=1955412 RepID=UPI00406BF959
MALVTGGTGGIGKETARALAERGASVVVAGIDRERGLRAVQDLKESAGHDRVHAVSADVTRLDGLRRLAEAVRERHDRLDVLVNNVGVNPPGRTLTADGVERMFAAHVLAPFTLTHLLLPLLERAPARASSTSPAASPAAPSTPATCWASAATSAGRSATTTTPRR